LFDAKGNQITLNNAQVSVTGSISQAVSVSQYLPAGNYQIQLVGPTVTLHQSLINYKEKVKLSAP
jgi:hypothetical protein